MLIPAKCLPTYDTLWFDLTYVYGLDSIKYAENYFYVNGSATAWKYKLVGGLSKKMLSRRFDLEFRKQYFYSYNEIVRKQ